jgi:hypothetical protein
MSRIIGWEKQLITMLALFSILQKMTNFMVRQGFWILEGFIAVHTIPR